RVSPVWGGCKMVLVLIMLVQPNSTAPVRDTTPLGPDGEPSSGGPWELVFTVDGQWATDITPYNGKLYLAERDYMNHTAWIYESTDGTTFTKKYNTNSDQVFVMGVNTNNNTLYIGTLWRIGQGIGSLFYVNNGNFGEFDTDTWWDSSTSFPAVPLSMQMYNGRFFVGGGLSWGVVGESGNKMWVKYEDPSTGWAWTDMSYRRVGTIIEAYSMEEYYGKLYVGTFEPAKVVVYDDASNMWNNSLTGIVDGPAIGNSGVIELINYSGKLHGLTWKYGNDWYYDGLSWQGGNVSQYGGFGRAIEHNGTLYAGTTPFYSDDGIKPWTWSNISLYDGLTWSDMEPIDTILPLYFAEHNGFIYATAGRRVYRMDANAPPPPITDPLKNLHARLEGPGLVSVNITWDLSEQEWWITNYTVYHSNTYRSDRMGYQFLRELPKGTTNFIHTFAGHGDSQNHFYYVQANGTNGSAQSVLQVGKFTRDLSQGAKLISIPLEQLDDSISSVFATVSYDRIWTYDSTPGSGGWKDYDPGKPWRDIELIDFERGYLVEVNSPGPMTIAGRLPASPVLHLYPGWNLMSFPSFENYDVTRVVAETGATRVETGDPLSVPYHLMEITGTTSLMAGEAYWIYVPTGVNWVLP
ncbi:MAG: hypothetical protein V3U51_02835, partial [Thermoplasmata archaeon]